MHSEAARQKRFQQRACWCIFDMIVVASTFFCASALCLCNDKPSAGKDDMHGS